MSGIYEKIQENAFILKGDLISGVGTFLLFDNVGKNSLEAGLYKTSCFALSLVGLLAIYKGMKFHHELNGSEETREQALQAELYLEPY